MGSDSSKKKFAIIGVSSILLVAAVVGTVTYGFSKHDNVANANAPQEVSTSSKAVQTVCGVTDYKETCQKSLSNATDNMDVKQIIHMALQSAVDSVRGVINSSSALSEAAKDPNVSAAFRVCNESLDLSIDNFERAMENINSPIDKDNFGEFMDDLTTWLSGTISLQEACLDAFDNSTGETGVKVRELMKSTRELSSNGLAMIHELSHVITGVTLPEVPASRRLLENSDNDSFPLSEHVRSLLAYNPRHPYHPRGPQALRPNAIVSPNARGKGQFRSIQAAINTAPKNVNQTFMILVKAGVYHEYVEIPKMVYNVYLVGEGPDRTRIIGNKNFVNGVKTWYTATVGVNGDNFIAKDISFENSAGAIKHQAVALRVSADKAIFYNCHMDGFQDTLYTVSGRQYFRDCTISGTIDFIFGDAASVFQNCRIVVRKPLPNQPCMVTAQGRNDPRSNGATVLHNCAIVPSRDHFPAPKGTFLGRPWKEYSRTIIMQSFIDGFIDPAGWAEWAGNFALNTLKYGEYQNRGPGANTARRVKWKGIQRITPQIAASFTPGTYLSPRQWLQPSGIPFVPGMMKV